MDVTWSQFYPPKPTFTEAELPPQSDKVFLVTGGYSGMGLELSTMLYRAHATVYVAGRTRSRAEEAISKIQSEVPDSRGRLEFLHVDLDNLEGIKASVEEFKGRESRLHVLWNNAGISLSPAKSVSKQGHELHLATNCLGPFLLTQLLMPLLERTAANEAAASVRVIWSASQTIDLFAPRGGFDVSQLHKPSIIPFRNYVSSKFGNWCLATELARRSGSTGVVSLAVNPGWAATDLVRDHRHIYVWLWPVLHAPNMTAYTQLYGGLSTDFTLAHNGAYVMPWGRIAREADLRKDLVHATKPVEVGGSGTASEFWSFCETATEAYR